MPNMKNAKKKVKANIKKTVTNNNYEASMKTAIKNVERAVNSNDKSKAEAGLNVAIKKIDKACKANAVSQNNGARNKSRITKKVNSMK